MKLNNVEVETFLESQKLQKLMQKKKKKKSEQTYNDVKKLNS